MTGLRRRSGGGGNGSSIAGGSTASSGPAIPYRTASGTLAAKIDLNRCKVDRLARLPGVSRAVAERVLDYRDEHGHFQHVSELWRVPGISRRLYDALSRNVYVAGAPTARRGGSATKRRSTRQRGEGGGGVGGASLVTPTALPSSTVAVAAGSQGDRWTWPPSSPPSSSSSLSPLHTGGVPEKSLSISQSSVLTESRQVRLERSVAVCGDGSAISAPAAAALRKAPAAAAAAVTSALTEIVQPLVVRTSASTSEVTLKYPLLNQRSTMPMAITVKLKPIARPARATAATGGGGSTNVKNGQSTPKRAADQRRPRTLAELGTDAVAKVGRSLSDVLSRLSGGSRSKQNNRQHQQQQQPKQQPKQQQQHCEPGQGVSTPNVASSPAQIEGWLASVNEAAQQRIAQPLSPPPPLAAEATTESRDCYDASAASKPSHFVGMSSSEVSYTSVVSSVELPLRQSRHLRSRRRTSDLAAKASDSLLLRRTTATRRAYREQRQQRQQPAQPPSPPQRHPRRRSADARGRRQPAERRRRSRSRHRSEDRTRQRPAKEAGYCSIM